MLTSSNYCDKIIYVWLDLKFIWEQGSYNSLLRSDETSKGLLPRDFRAVGRRRESEIPMHNENSRSIWLEEEAPLT